MSFGDDDVNTNAVVVVLVSLLSPFSNSLMIVRLLFCLDEYFRRRRCHHLCCFFDNADADADADADAGAGADVTT